MALEAEFVARSGNPSYGLVHGAEGIGVGRGVRAPRTAQLTLPEGHELGAVARLAPRTLVKVYDRRDDATRVLKHVGPLTSYQRAAGDSVTIALGSHDAAWYLDHRILAVRNPNRLMQKRGHILKWIVQRLQDEAIADAAYNAVDGLGASIYGYRRFTYAFGSNPVLEYTGSKVDTGIRVRTIADTPTVLIDEQPFTKASGLFAMATAGLDGPDWHIYPSEPTADTPGVRLGWLDVAPVIGAERPHVIFEYGAGKRNVTGFEETIDPNTQAVAVTATTPTGELSQWDKTNFDLFGPLDDVITTQVPSSPYTTVNGVPTGPGAMVAQLLADHIDVRRLPRQVITFTVAPDPDPASVNLSERRVPRPGTDYDFGDIVTFRATERVPVYAADRTLLGFTEKLTVDALFRVYHLQETDDENGQRVTQLTVVASS